QFNGALDVNKDEFDELVITLKNGTLDIKTSLDRRLIWDCKMERPPGEDFIEMATDIIAIDMEKSGGANCELVVPPELKLTITGEEGQITLTEPEFDSYLEIGSGNVLIRPGPELNYKYNLNVKNGHVE